MLCTLLVAACVTDNWTTAVATPFWCNDLNKFASQAWCPDTSPKWHCLEHMKLKICKIMGGVWNRLLTVHVTISCLLVVSACSHTYCPHVRVRERERRHAVRSRKTTCAMHYITGMKVITTTEQKMYHLLQSISSMHICVFGVFRVVVRPCVARTRFLSLVWKTEIRSRVWLGRATYCKSRLVFS